MLDKQKLIEFLESEMKNNSADYVIAIKWAAYNVEKGRFDIKEESANEEAR